jgi:predicted  nucleic acid-binding Zn-ribbon protein
MMKVFSAIAAGVALAAAPAAASPVTQVVELIKELQAKIVSDGENEQKVYDKFACWCEKTTDRKAKSIEQAKVDIARLGNEVLSLKGKVATLAAEIAKLQKHIKENESAQAKATSIRQKENSDFQQEKAEMEQTLNALERAVKVLSGAGTAAGQALLQMNSQDKATIEAALEMSDVHNKHVALIRQLLKGGASYAPQSSTVQGILKDMYTTFATNLEENTQQEFTSQTAFEKKIALLQEELAAMQATVLKKQAQKAEAAKLLADTQQSLEDTTNQMNDDAEFFDLTKKNCKAKSDEWSERTRARTEELDGIAKALEILTSDEARALFDKAIKPGMETGMASNRQVGAKNRADKYDGQPGKDVADFERRTETAGVTSMFIQTDMEKRGINRAIAAISKVAAANKSLKLAALAVQMRKAGHFDKVIKAIDDMISTLGEEAQDDITKRDACKLKTHTKTEEKSVLEHKIERNTLKIEKLTFKKEKLQENIEFTVEAIKQTSDDLKSMKADREAENAAFLQAKEDDENAVTLLTNALAHLSSYIDNNGGVGELQSGRQAGLSFVQIKEHVQASEPEFEISEDQASEANFKGADSNKQESKGIISILTMLKEDLNDEIANGVKAEEASEKMYQENKAAAEKLRQALREKKTNTEGEKADTEDEIDSTEELKKTNEASLDAKIEELAVLKPGCDWMLANFEKRAEFRVSESEGLAQAKAILSGMQTSLLAQKAKVTYGSKFDDAAFGNAVASMGFLQRK